MPATISADHAAPSCRPGGRASGRARSRRRRGSRGCSAAGARPRASTPLKRPNSRSASIAYCEHDGWYLQVPRGDEHAEACSGRRRRGRSRAYLMRPPSRAPRRRARRATREPCASVGLGEAGPHDQHVVAAGRIRPSRSRQSSRSWRLILFRVTALPTALRDREPEPGLAVGGVVLARERVEDEVARRDRAPLPVDGVEVARA